MRLKAAIVVVTGLFGTLFGAAGSGAQVASGSPLDCPGVVEVPGGYLLTEDVTCSFGWWTDDDATFDLGGHTFTGRVSPAAAHQTVRNGTIVLDDDWWVDASDFTVSDVTVQPLSSTGCSSLCIEAGDVTVEDSTFRDFPGIALSFYFAGGATIRSSTFIGNRIAISIQNDRGFLIDGNRFLDNETGVNLWTEDGFGVNDVTIRGNLFRGNLHGIEAVSSDIDGVDGELLSRITIERNQLVDNGASGISVGVLCPPDGPCNTPQDNVVGRNVMRGNGFEPDATSSALGDGMTARGGDGTSDSWSLLAGFTLTGNRADRNADLGLDVPGVIDGGRNRARGNGNPAQCVGVDCGTRPPCSAGPSAAAAGEQSSASAARLPDDQVAHDPDERDRR